MRGDLNVSKSILFHLKNIKMRVNRANEFPYLWILLFSVQSSHSVMFKSLWPHGLQHARVPCPSTTLGACSNSCPLSQWYHPTISSSVIQPSHPLLLLPSIFPSIRVFSSKSVLRIKWPKYWSFSFSISLSSDYSGLISFRIDWFDLLAVLGTLKSPAPQFKRSIQLLF